MIGSPVVFMILFFYFISLGVGAAAAGSGAAPRKVYSKESHRCLLLQVHRSEGNEGRKKRDAHFTACRHQTRQEKQKEEKKGKKEKGKKENRLLLYSFHCLPHRILGWFSIFTRPQRTHHQQTDTLFTARLKHAYIFMTILFTAPNRTASCVTWNWLALLAVAFLFFFYFFPFVAFLSASLFRRQSHLPRQTTRISPRRSLAPLFRPLFRR